MIVISNRVTEVSHDKRKNRYPHWSLLLKIFSCYKTIVYIYGINDKKKLKYRIHIFLILLLMLMIYIVFKVANYKENSRVT